VLIKVRLEQKRAACRPAPRRLIKAVHQRNTSSSGSQWQSLRRAVTMCSPMPGERVQWISV